MELGEDRDDDPMDVYVFSLACCEKQNEVYLATLFNRNLSLSLGPFDVGYYYHSH